MGRICSPLLHRESYSPMIFVSKMTGLWKLHVNVTEILLDKKIIKTSLTSIKNTKKKTETHSKLTSQSWSTECAKFSFGPAFHFQKRNYMYTHLKLKISQDIVSCLPQSWTPYHSLLSSPFLRLFHTSTPQRTIELLKYIVKNDNEFMTGEKYDYMYILNLSDYSSLPDLKEVWN